MGVWYAYICVFTCAGGHMCLSVCIVEFDIGCLSRLFFPLHTEAGSLTLKSELTSLASLLAHLPWDPCFLHQCWVFNWASDPTLHLHECRSLNPYLNSWVTRGLLAELSPSPIFDIIYLQNSKTYWGRTFWDVLKYLGPNTAVSPHSLLSSWIK